MCPHLLYSVLRAAVRAHAQIFADRSQPSAGVLQARGGKDYVLAHGPGERSVIRKDIFGALYEPLGGCLFRKRADIIPTSP